MVFSILHFLCKLKVWRDPCHYEKTITFLPRTWLSLKYDHFVMDGRSNMGLTAIERSFRVDLETHVVFKN